MVWWNPVIIRASCKTYNVKLVNNGSANLSGGCRATFSRTFNTPHCGDTALFVIIATFTFNFVVIRWTWKIDATNYLAFCCELLTLCFTHFI